jgi:hypothetical protein
MRNIVLGAIYVNRSWHRLQPYHINVSAGRVNARVQAHNFTTGYDEAWSVRLFLSDHEREVAMRKTHLSTGPFAVWHEPLTRQRVVGVLYRHGFDRDGAIRIADAAALHYRHKFLVTDSAGDVVYIAEVKE